MLREYKDAHGNIVVVDDECTLLGPVLQHSPEISAPRFTQIRFCAVTPKGKDPRTFGPQPQPAQSGGSEVEKPEFLRLWGHNV